MSTVPTGMFTSLEEIQASRNVNKNGWIWRTKKYGQKLIYPPQEQLRRKAIMKAK